jgi:hypothetical protein
MGVLWAFRYEVFDTFGNVRAFLAEGGRRSFDPEETLFF